MFQGDSLFFGQYSDVIKGEIDFRRYGSQSMTGRYYTPVTVMGS